MRQASDGAIMASECSGLPLRELILTQLQRREESHSVLHTEESH